MSHPAGSRKNRPPHDDHPIRIHSPEMADLLGSRTFDELETPDRSLLTSWSQSALTGLVAPVSLGGSGLNLMDLYDHQRAVGYRSPSLGAATTMHHTSILALTFHAPQASAAEQDAIRRIVEARSVVASAFSEGVPGGSIFRPTVAATRGPEVFTLDGAKGPCSLSSIMDFALVSAHCEDVGTVFALVAADAPGLSVEALWTSPILRAADSNTVRFADTPVAPEHVLVQSEADPGRESEAAGYLFFGVLISAVYLGAAFRLFDELAARRVPTLDEELARAYAILCHNDRAMARLARDYEDADDPWDLSSALLQHRISIESNLDAIAQLADVRLGGGALATHSVPSRIAQVLRVYKHHPPNRPEVHDAILRERAGAAYRLPE